MAAAGIDPPIPPQPVEVPLKVIVNGSGLYRKFPCFSITMGAVQSRGILRGGTGPLAAQKATSSAVPGQQEPERRAQTPPFLPKLAKVNFWTKTSMFVSRIRTWGDTYSALWEFWILTLLFCRGSLNWGIYSFLNFWRSLSCGNLFWINFTYFEKIESTYRFFFSK
jgi:hypothetical protein